MQRVKRRIFSGPVCEQEVFTVSDRANIKKAAPRERFKTDEEREQHRIGISRRKHARLFNENFSPQSLYSTLTLDDENEVYEFRDMKKLRYNYVRNLKRAYPDAVIFAYIGRGKSTQRMHMHVVSSGVPRDVIETKWIYGSVKRIENLREHNFYDGKDHGRDYTGLANYLFDHWTPEQGGHRWKQTENARKPDFEKPKPVKREYSDNKPPIAPKGYVLVESRSNRFGYQYYKYVEEPKRSRRRKC